MGTTLVIVATIRQVDGGLRHLMSPPGVATDQRAQVRADWAMIDGISPDVIVDSLPGEPLRAYEWPGRGRGLPPPWAAIRAALGLISA